MLITIYDLAPLPEQGLRIVTGPSGCGKSRMFRKLGANRQNTCTSEGLQQAIVYAVTHQLSPEHVAEGFSHICFFENLESLAGKPLTQQMAARIFQAMAKDRCVLASCIEPERTIPHLLKELKRS